MESMGDNAAASLNFNNLVRVPLSNDAVYYLVPGKTNPDAFVVLWMDGHNNLRKGVQVVLGPEQTAHSYKQAFTGTLSIADLGGRSLLVSKVERGYILALHTRKRSALNGIQAKGEVVPVEPDPYQTLSEVVVVATRSVSGNYTIGTWMNINVLFEGGGGGLDYYIPVNGAEATGAEGTITSVDPIKVDDELGVLDPAIDVGKYLDCFNKLPDAGAVCSIELFTDIPVDNDPNRLVDWRSGSAGHTFLQFRKQVGGQIIIQNIGFYPVSSWKVSFTNAPVAGKFVDNGNHEFNASLAMPVSAENFRRALNELRYLAASSTYDLDEFNCTDLSVRVFNAARVDKLDIPLYQIPGGITAAGTSTPQGVYNKLKAMQAAGVAEAANISIPGVKGFVANSDGPCN